MHNLVNWNEITPALLQNYAARCTDEREENVPRYYICKFFNLRNGQPQRRAAGKWNTERVASVHRKMHANHVPIWHVNTNEWASTRILLSPQLPRSITFANDIKRKTVTKLPHNNYRDWHRSRADNRLSIEVELRPHYIHKVSSSVFFPPGQQKQKMMVKYRST